MKTSDAAPRKPRLMRTAMHHGMTTIASTILVVATTHDERMFVRIGAYCAYWLSCALAFVPVVHASDRAVRKLSERLHHVATDQLLHDEILRYREQLDASIEASTVDVSKPSDTDD